MPYMLWALLSALFAGVTALLAKQGVEDVPSNLAIAVRTVVAFLFAWTVAFGTNQVKFGTLNSRAMLYLVGSGLATGASWLCYFKAIKLGPISRVAPIDKLSFVIAMLLGFLVLREKPTANVLVGAALIVTGVLITLL